MHMTMLATKAGDNFDIDFSAWKDLTVPSDGKVIRKVPLTLF